MGDVALTADLGAAAYRAATGLGHNNPPADPWEGLKCHLDDLLTEAHAWADGTKVESQAQADEASRLIDDLMKGAKAAEAQRVAEKTPLDVQIAEIQGRYNEYIAPATNKTPGKVHKAIVALKATVKPFLDKLLAEQQAEAARKRAEAEEAARIAAEASRAADPSNLAAQDEAEELIRAAERASADAKRAENARAQARGGERAMGLTRTYTPVRIDDKAAILHYMDQDPEAFLALVDQLAARDVREGKRTIPGYEIREGTRL